MQDGSCRMRELSKALLLVFFTVATTVFLLTENGNAKPGLVLLCMDRQIAR
jgi:hypothetical protein